MQVVSRTVLVDPKAAALYRRVAWRLMPLLIACYVCAIIDRLNVSMAKLQMLSELNFSEAVYGFGAGVFFVGYFLFDIPSNLILHRVGAKWWIARIMIVWGLVSVATAFVVTPLSFYVMRFALGLAEAGFFAGLVLYATYWFPVEWRGRIFAGMILAVPIAGVIVGPTSGVIMRGLNDVGGLSGWQWLFVIEGVPSIILGIFVFRFLDSRVEDASWLSPEEKAQIREGLQSDAASGPKSYEFLVSGMVWLMSSVCFAISAGMAVVSFWLPTLINAAGPSSALAIGFYSAIPWLVAVGPVVIGGRRADRSGRRRWYVAGPLFICGAALVLSTVMSGLISTLVLLTIATSGILLALAQFWSLPAAYLSGVAAAGGIALINAVGNLAGFLTPVLIGTIKQATNSTDYGVLLAAGIIILGGALTLFIPGRLVDDRDIASDSRKSRTSSEIPIIHESMG